MDPEEVEEVTDVLNDALKDMKDYTQQILEQIDLLFKLVHGALRKDKEVEVNKALNDMFNEEHGEKILISQAIRKKSQAVRARIKRKVPPVQNLEAARLSLEKDPDVALQPGTLAYSVTPGQLAL